MRVVPVEVSAPMVLVSSLAPPDKTTVVVNVSTYKPVEKTVDNVEHPVLLEKFALVEVASCLVKAA